MDGQKIETKSRKQLVYIAHTYNSQHIAMDLLAKVQQCFSQRHFEMK